MTDEILNELWRAKDEIAKEFSYNIDRLAEHYMKNDESKYTCAQEIIDRKKTH